MAALCGIFSRRRLSQDARGLCSLCAIHTLGVLMLLQLRFFFVSQRDADLASGASSFLRSDNIMRVASHCWRVHTFEWVQHLNEVSRLAANKRNFLTVPGSAGALALVTTQSCCVQNLAWKPRKNTICYLCSLFILDGGRLFVYSLMYSYWNFNFEHSSVWSNHNFFFIKQNKTKQNSKT